ncbi:MAG: phage exclusion protein Lit family protein [Rhodomicrobium sp.]
MTDPENPVYQDSTVQSAAMRVLLGSAPEREMELRELWRLLDPKFQFVGDVHEGERFILDAGAFRFVRFNHRAVRAFWLSAFAAWEGYRLVAETIDIGNVDLGRLAKLIEAFRQILTSDKSDEKLLPDGIPEPGTYPEAVVDPQQRAAAELATMAVGWALLHEVRHIKHQQEGTGADPYGQEHEPFHEEELSCDAFATTFLLERVDDYAASVSADQATVRRKRELAIYFAMFTITLLAEGKWGPTPTHPSVQRRIDAVQAVIGQERDEIAEAIAHIAFVALRALWPDAPTLAA